MLATWFSPTSMNFDVNLTDGSAHQVALYSVDWETNERDQTIEVLDAGTGKVLDSRSISKFAGGQYVVWTSPDTSRFESRALLDSMRWPARYFLTAYQVNHKRIDSRRRIQAARPAPLRTRRPDALCLRTRFLHHSHEGCPKQHLRNGFT